MVDNPHQTASHAAVDGEKRLPPLEWNDTRRDYPQVCVHQLLEGQAGRTPDSVAVADDKQQLTYRQLNTRANQLGRYLKKLGVGPDVLVGVAVERSAQLLVALLGVLKAGGAYVPLDVDYPRERLIFMAVDSGLKVVLTDEASRAKLPAQIGRQVCLDSHWGAISQEIGENFSSGVEPNNLAYVIYTSGSTGEPKGVLTPHRALVNYLESARIRPGFTAQDIFLSTNTISFDMSKPELFLPLIVGGQVYVANRGIANDVKRFEALLAASRATVLQGAPSFWRLLIESGWRGGNTLKILSGGEVLPGSLAKELLKRSLSVWNGYGPTETTVWATLYQVKSAEAPILIGTPLFNTQTYILDDELRPVPVGVTGELHIGGHGLARGYLNRPELTAEKFIPNPLTQEPAARLYKTGDLARYMPDGNIEFAGRADHQVKIRGFRIELGEVEALLAQHPSVEVAVVETREDTRGDARLVAYVVPRGLAPTTDDLRAFLRNKLPEYMLPSRFEFLDALPLTPNGKVDRQALPAPGRSRQTETHKNSAPGNELEEKLVPLFASVLGLDWVGAEENFFDLGGASILALELIAKVEKAVGRKISLAALVEAPSVRKLALFLSAANPPKGVPGIIALQPRGSRPPFFCIGVGPFVRPMAPWLGSDQPLFGLILEEALEEADWASMSAPFTTEDVSAVLIKRMRDVQPKGPYFLGGFCFDGALAYEMARQLRVLREDVGVVVMMNPWSPPRANGNLKSEGISRRIKGLRQKLKSIVLQFREQGMIYILERLQSRLTALRLWADRTVYKLRVHWGLPIRGQLRDLDHVLYFAMLNYRPQRYSGDVAMVRCVPGSYAGSACTIRSELSWPEEPRKVIPPQPPAGRRAESDSRCEASPYLHYGEDLALGWDELVGGRLEVQFVPAYFEDMLKEPCIEITARKLKDILLYAQGAREEKEMSSTGGPL